MFGLSINEPSPIIKAIQAGQSLDAIKALLTAGADVNRSDRYGKFPLMEALHTGPISLVRLLLEHGADPNDTRSGGNRVSYTEPMAPPLVRVAANGAIYEFMNRHGVELVDLLICHGADVNGNAHGNQYADSPLKYSGDSPLNHASANGKLDMVRLLLDRGAAVDSQGPLTALSYACSARGRAEPLHIAVAELLISRGADIHREIGSVSALRGPDLYALFDPVPPPPRVRLRTHWRLRIAFHVIGRRASNPRSKRHELGLYRVSDIASFLLPGE